MNKPVNCGCGGKAVVFLPFGNHGTYMIECQTCGICTRAFDTEVEAVKVWNKAMGADKNSIISVFSTEPMGTIINVE